MLNTLTFFGKAIAIPINVYIFASVFIVILVFKVMKFQAPRGGCALSKVYVNGIRRLIS